MNKILTVALTGALLLGACGNTPQQKAKELEKEFDDDYKKRGIDTDYKFYYDNLINFFDNNKETITSIDDANEQLDPDEDDPDYIKWNLKMASSYIVGLDDENMEGEINDFKEKNEYSPTPKKFQKLEDDIFKSIKDYRVALNDYKVSMETGAQTEQQLTKVKELHKKLGEYDDDLEKLRKLAYDN